MELFWIEKSGKLFTGPWPYFIFVFGTFIGSFLNVVIFRVPEKSFFNSSRSKCPNCHSLIPFYLNIPILSYVLLLGRSQCCKQKISLQYPIVEFLTGALFLFLYVKNPFLFTEYGKVDFVQKDSIRFLHSVIFFSYLLSCSVIDLRHKIIPDVLSFPMILCGPLFGLIHPELTSSSSLIGILVGGGSVYVIAWTYYLIRKDEGIGMGDAKLLAAIGAWLGYQSIFPTFLYASVIGSIVGVAFLAITKKLKAKAALPFGPFLAIGSLIHYSFGSQLLIWIIGR